MSILVGRCWLKKYERTFRAIEAHVHEKYSSKVEIVSRLKKQSPVVSTLSIGSLFLSCILFLILMFS